VTLTVKIKMPEVVGIPAICPVFTPSERPGGKIPSVTVHVFVPTPPVARSKPVYGDNLTPSLREVVAI